MRTTLPTPHGEVLIRSSLPEDWTAYRALRLQALMNHPTAFGAEYEESRLRPDEHWQRRVNTDDEREALFFAEHGGALIGTTGIYRDSGRRTRHSAEVWGVYVKPEWRGARIAEALIQACLEWGRKQGIVIARLGVATNNLPAIRCYQRCGFVICGTLPKVLLHEGQYVDEFLMACSF